MKKNITLADGAGGPETAQIVKELFSKAISMSSTWRSSGIIGLDVMDDSGFVQLPNGSYMAITIDSFTVKPFFFKGGSIGKLAADGTINDLIVSGARPLAIVDAIVVEEGMDMDLVKRAVDDFVNEAIGQNVAIVGGDFKVMPKGQVEGLVITTAGIGIAKLPITDDRISHGDKIILTGGIGEHGAVIAAHQFGLELGGSAMSDSSPLTPLLPLLEKYGDLIHAARDPTRGGIAMALNEWAEVNGVRIIVNEQMIPVKDWVRGISEVLGVDPLALASEGRAILAVDSSISEKLLKDLKDNGFTEAQIIGDVEKGNGEVLLRTRIGGLRVLEPPAGLMLPRIC